MKIMIVQVIQKFFSLFGLHVRRLGRGVSLVSALDEQIRLVGPDIKVIVEVGAADGRDTLIYAQRFGLAKVIAYEPIPESYSKIAVKAESEERIIAINAAVSSENKIAAMYQTVLTDSSSLMKPVEIGGTLEKYHKVKSVIEVQAVRLDDEMKRLKTSRINILKIDAQGLELDVLMSVDSFLSQKRIDLIYAEVCFVDLYEGGVLYHDLAKYLFSKGYKLHSLYDLQHQTDGSLAWADAIFLPNE